MTETCTDCYKAISDEELVWSDGFKDDQGNAIGQAPYHADCYDSMRRAFQQDFAKHQEKVKSEREAREHPEKELLTKAISHYVAKEMPAGDRAAAEWLVAFRHVKTDATGKMYAFIPDVGHYKIEGDILLKADIAQAFGSLANRTRVGEIIARVQAISYTNQETLDATTPPNLIPLKNGIYNLTTRNILPHSPDYFFTYVHPVKFDPAATCPTIQKFLDSVVATQREREILIDIMALCLYRARVTRHFFILVGKGHNGKSKFLIMVKSLLGKQRVVSLTPQALAEDVFAPAQLHDKHANLGADIPGGYIKDTAIIKAATGGDSVSVQRKGVDRDERELYCEFVWGSNEPPRIPEDTLAIWDRLVVIIFPYIFMAKPSKNNEKLADDEIEQHITTPEELSGLLNVILLRLPELLKNHKLSVPVSPEETRREYRSMSDTVSVFVDEMCEETDYEPYEPPHTPASGYVTAAEAYREYKAWCRENRATPVSANKFGRAIEALGFEKGKDAQERTYRGLQIKQTGRTDRTDIPYSTRTQGESKEKNREKSVQSVQAVLEVTEEIVSESLIHSSEDLVVYLRKAEMPVPRDVILESVGYDVGNFTDRGFWLDVTLKALEKEVRIIRVGADSWEVLE